jgi:hypothetical protein
VTWGFRDHYPARDFTLFDRLGLPKLPALARIAFLSWLSGP